MPTLGKFLSKSFCPSFVTLVSTAHMCVNTVHYMSKMLPRLSEMLLMFGTQGKFVTARSFTPVERRTLSQWI